MRAIGMTAAIVSGLIAAPVSAAADETITESFSTNIAPATVPNDLPPSFAEAGVGTTVFPLFNRSIGTLDNVSVTLSGVISAASIAENPTIDFFLVDPNEMLITSQTHIPVTATIQLSLSIDSAPDPVSFIGVGDTRIDLDFGTADPDRTIVIESVGSITGSVTYDYTAATTTASVPEPSTWAMVLLGFAGLAFAGRSVRGGLLNRTRFAGAC